jgi:uncharacterized protein with HEPN domain
LAIAEESKKLEAGLKVAYPQVSWKSLAGLRNRLAHDYRGTDPNISFESIQDYLPPLKTALLAMLDEIEYDAAMLAAALASDYYRHITYLKSKLP